MGYGGDNCDKAKSLSEYCDNDSSIDDDGIILQFVLDKSKDSEYKKIISCAKDVIRNLPQGTLTPVLFHPHQYSYAEIETHINPQKYRKDNTPMFTYLKTTQDQIENKTISQGQLNMLSYLYTNGQLSSYFGGVSSIHDTYNADNSLSEVLITMSDDQGGNKNEKFNSQYGNSFKETKMTIGSDHMKHFASKDNYHAKWDFSKNGKSCGNRAFMKKIKNKLCAVLSDFEASSRADQTSTRRRRAMLNEKRKYDIEMMQKMENEKAAGRYSLEYGVDWNRFDDIMAEFD